VPRPEPVFPDFTRRRRARSKPGPSAIRQGLRELLVIAEEEVPWLVSQKVDRQALLVLAEKLVSS
jgi:hypothetical protein